MEEDKHLYFRYSEKRLVWEDPETAAGKNDLLLLVEFKFADDGSGFTYTNKHPAPIFAKVRESIYKEVAAGNLQYKWGRNVYRKRKGGTFKEWQEDIITLPPACQMIFFLALEAGMRRAEIEAARREWFSVQGDICLVSIQNVEGEANANGKVVGEFQTKSREKAHCPHCPRDVGNASQTAGPRRAGILCPAQCPQAGR